MSQLEWVLDAYSEYSITEFKENLVIGGHDLVGELTNYKGKFLLLVVEKVN